jgi:hypothetical protein
MRLTGALAFLLCVRSILFSRPVSGQAASRSASLRRHPPLPRQQAGQSIAARKTTVSPPQSNVHCRPGLRRRCQDWSRGGCGPATRAGIVIVCPGKNLSNGQRRPDCSRTRRRPTTHVIPSCSAQLPSVSTAKFLTPGADPQAVPGGAGKANTRRQEGERSVPHRSNDSPLRAGSIPSSAENLAPSCPPSDGRGRRSTGRMINRDFQALRRLCRLLQHRLTPGQSQQKTYCPEASPLLFRGTRCKRKGSRRRRSGRTARSWAGNRITGQSEPASLARAGKR